MTTYAASTGRIADEPGPELYTWSGPGEPGAWSWVGTPGFLSTRSGAYGAPASARPIAALEAELSAWTRLTSTTMARLDEFIDDVES